MTDDNKRLNIRLELAKADREMQSARLVLHNALLDTAIAHAYYAAFHHARALILMEGLEAKTHGGVIHLVNLHFVRSGRLAPEMGDVLAQLQSRRERADYDAAAVFTEAMALEALEKSGEFGAAVRQVLSDSRLV